MRQRANSDPDYDFGHVMLTLRDAIGLTQATLAQYLGVSRHAVGDWERGNKYPSATHLKAFIALAVQQGAFPAGREAEPIRALWRAARQKVLLDEGWLTALLAPDRRATPAAPDTEPVQVPRPAALASQAAAGRPRLDWDDALAVPRFYGREWELGLLTEWVVEERCQVVSVLGLGGIGKSALAVRLMRRLAEGFEVVIWRSVRNAPACADLIDDCLQVLAPQDLGQAPLLPALPASSEQRLDLLLEHLRSRRVLLVLDNLETLLEEGDESGRLRAGHEDYGQLLRQVAQTKHQSCLLFTSREKPGDLVLLEGSRSPVRSLRLARLDAEACGQLLSEANIEDAAPERARLIDAYTGNPLALKIVAQTIVDLFGGAIAPFLREEALIFGGVRDLLAQQFNRLSPLEQSIMFWLAIMREPVTFDELREVLITPVPRVQLLEGIDALRRRSLVERGHTPGSFTLQSVVLEYVTARLVAEAGAEIGQGRLARLIAHSLSVALAPEYVRQMQARLIVVPLLEYLQSAVAQPTPAGVAERISALLDELRARPVDAQGYGPANMVALLIGQRGDLRGVDLAGLALRGVYFGGVEMQGASLARATIRDSVFTESFDAILAVAVSGDGLALAACSMQGDVRLWSTRDYTLQHNTHDIGEHLESFALSPDGRMLAAANWKYRVKLWDLSSGALLWSAPPHGGTISGIVFTPDGQTIATICIDRSARLWDARSGQLLGELPHPEMGQGVELRSVSCSPNGQLLATADMAGTLYLWALNTQNGTATGTLLATVAAHTHMVSGLAFSPQGDTLASVSRDGSVKLWEMPAGRLLATLPGGRGPLRCVAWSPDGQILAFAGQDQLIWLWDVWQDNYRAALHGHTGMVRGLAFTTDSRRLLSGGDDGTLRVWEIASGRGMHVMQGHARQVQCASWSEDGARLASASTDNVITIYDVSSTRGADALLLLHGHRRWITELAWSPDGRRLASSDVDNTIRLWDTQSGACLETFGHPDDPNNFFFGLAWSLDGRWLAAGSPQHGALLWDMSDPAPHRRMARQWGEGAESVIWSPDGTRLGVRTSTDNICVWDAQEGVLRQRMIPEYGHITSFAWSADGSKLAAAASSGEDGGCLIWDTQSGALLHTVRGPTDMFYALAWGANDAEIVVGAINGRLSWWDIASGSCVQVNAAHEGAMIADLKRSPDTTRLASCGYDGAIELWDVDTRAPIRTLRRDRPYERLDITGIRGLGEARKAALRALGAAGEGIPA